MAANWPDNIFTTTFLEWLGACNQLDISSFWTPGFAHVLQDSTIINFFDGSKAFQTVIAAPAMPQCAQCCIYCTRGVFFIILKITFSIEAYYCRPIICHATEMPSFLIVVTLIKTTKFEISPSNIICEVQWNSNRCIYHSKKEYVMEAIVSLDNPCFEMFLYILEIR